MRTLALLLLICAITCAQPVPYKISTAAGTYATGDGGPATAAPLSWPRTVAIDAAGNIFTSEDSQARVRKIAPDGTISTYAGTGIYGYPTEGAKATETNVTLQTSALALDSAGNLYMATDNYWTVHKISPAGVVTKFAGASCCSNAGQGDGGPALKAIIGWVNGLLADKAGNVYIAAAHRVRKVDSKGVITLVAGTGEAGYSGDGQPATAAKLNSPQRMALDADGNLYIADYGNFRIRKVGTDGRISTYAGGGYRSEGAATDIFLALPVGLALDSTGGLYVTAAGVSRIYRIAPAVSGVAQAAVVAGTGTYGFSGDGGPATLARIRNPQEIAVDAAGNIYFADYGNKRIRKIDTAGNIGTVAGTSHLTGDGGKASSAQLFFPTSVATDSQGNLFIADNDNNRIRKVDSKGIITSVAGVDPPDDGTSGPLDPGPALERPIGWVAGMATDNQGNIYLADQSYYRIRKISASGTLSIVAGNGKYANDGDGVATSLAVYPNGGITTDSDGNVYFADLNKIRKLTLDGKMTTIAGTGTAGYFGDGGLATIARVSYPAGLDFDAKGNLFISDTGNSCIRRLGTDGIITTVAGKCGTAGYSGDRGKAIAAMLNQPQGISFDADGNLFIVDSGNCRIRVLATDGNIYTVAGTGAPGYSGDGGNATDARLGGGFAPLMGITLIGKTVYFSDLYNHRVRQLVANLPSSLTIVSGDGQSATVGTPAASALIVRVLGPDGTPVPGITVNFAVASGGATISTASSVTGSDGRAGVSVTMGNTAGTVTVTATVAGLPAATFTLTALAKELPPANPDTPAIAAGGIAQNGFSVPSVRDVSPGAITSIFGSNFAPAGSAPVSGALSGGRMATRLAGICVTFGGVQAPVLAVSPSQLTVQVPNVQPGAVAVQVLRNCGDAGELKSNLMNVTARDATPELLYLKANADGNNPVAAVGSAGQWIGPADAIPGVNLTPARAGDVLVLYALGFGATVPAVTPGTPASVAAKTAAPFKITIGDVELSDSDVYYAGVSPTYLGLYQVNLKLPGAVRPGLQKVVVRVGSNSSPDGGYLAIAQ